MICTGIEQFIEIDGLMRTMEIADAEVDDPGLQIGLAIAGNADILRQVLQRGFREFNSHRA